MQYLKIRNWDKWQTYRKDRGQPPWIKVYRRLHQDINYLQLTTSERGQLVDIWLTAADREGSFPADPNALMTICRWDLPVDLNRLIELGFIEPDDQVTTTCQPHDDQVTHQIRDRDRGEKRQINGQTGFDQFWENYPKKVKKKNSIDIWKRKRLADKTQIIVTDIQFRKIHDTRWAKGFIPDPPTYLNQERWDDEYEMPELQN